MPSATASGSPLPKRSASASILARRFWTPKPPEAENRPEFWAYGVLYWTFKPTEYGAGGHRNKAEVLAWYEAAAEGSRPRAQKAREQLRNEN